MAGKKYCFDPETLAYKKVDESVRHKIVKIGLISIAIFTVALVCNLYLIHKGLGFEVRSLIKENDAWVSKYQNLKGQIQDMNHQLSSIANRDDEIYRPIFELDPLPSTIRAAGFGGSYKYDVFDGLENPDFFIDVTKSAEELSKYLYIQSKSYDQIINKAFERKNYFESKPLILPIAAKDLERISDYFGWRIDPITHEPGDHKGIDLKGERGVKVYATGKGVVTEAGYSFTGYGNEIEIDHGFGFKTRYAHLNEIDVNAGESVIRGQLIGKMGNTGRSTGVHLHYEIRIKGIAVNPLFFINDSLNQQEFQTMVNTYTEIQK